MDEHSRGRRIVRLDYRLLPVVPVQCARPEVIEDANPIRLDLAAWLACVILHDETLSFRQVVLLPIFRDGRSVAEPIPIEQGDGPVVVAVAVCGDYT